ncbi:MAG: hypothetical protein RIS47_226 [Bacteroidota bacterium]|jgi:arsenate reductase
MSTFKIYHNNRCSKSRAGLQYLEEKGINPEVVEYMNEPLTAEELTTVLEKLGMTPLELIRKDETIYKEMYKGHSFSDADWITIMLENPRLIERPIIVKGDKAVVARPTEKIDELL